MRAAACTSRNGGAIRLLLQREARPSAIAASASCRCFGTVRPRRGGSPAANPPLHWRADRSYSVGGAATPSRCCLDETRQPWREVNTTRRRKSSLAVEEASPSASPEDSVPAPLGTVPIPFLLADIGEGIAEVELIEWHVSPGQFVREHDTVADVQSDKATVPLTSRYEGTVVDLCGMRGDMIETGSPLMHIAVEAGRYGTDAGAGGGGGAPPAEISAEEPAAAAEVAEAAAQAPSAPATTASTGKKVVPFLMADIGEGIVEVELLQWYVGVGDHVRAFDKVADVQSDKAAVEIPSRYDGVVTELCGQKGDIIKVGSPLMHIEVEDSAGGRAGAEASTGDDMAGAEQAAASSVLHNADELADRLHIPSVPPSHFPSADEDHYTTSAGTVRAAKVLASPAVRKLGKDHGIDLSSISGSGPKGRILKADLLKIVRGREPPAAAAVPVAAAVAQPAAADAMSPAAGQPTEEAAKVSIASEPQFIPGEDVTVPLRGYSRLMVKAMTASLQIPHMVYSDEVDASSLLDVKRQLRPLANSKGVEKLTLLPFLIKAASLAMVEYPVINATLDAEGNTVTYRGNHDIGVAMDTPRGLAVPVIRECQDRSVLDIAMELNRLQKLAAEGSLAESDLTNPTFTLSNIGALGGTYMSPVVSPPQVAIGAVGKIQRLPRFVGDTREVEEAHVMNISWGGDHRVIDGATMARFSNSWKEFVENPVSMTLVTK